jgi:restriction endonuclease S subunit
MKVLNNDTEDLSLVKKVKSNNCNDSFIKLSSSYENFYFSIAKKYTPALLKMGMNKDDIKSEQYYILYKAISSFDAKQKTKFSTWFCNCSRYHFLNYILSSDLGQSQVLFNLTGGNREGLTIEGIRNFRITIPPMNEQIQIIQYLDSKTNEIDDLVHLEKKKIDLLKEYRQSLISEVVTGKIKVTN